MRSILHRAGEAEADIIVTIRRRIPVPISSAAILRIVVLPIHRDRPAFARRLRQAGAIHTVRALTVLDPYF